MNYKSIVQKLKINVMKLKKKQIVKSTIYKSMFVVATLLLVFLLTKINTNPTNNILETIRTNINYEFHVRDDSVKLYNKARQVFNQTLESIPVFNTVDKIKSPLRGTIYRGFHHQINSSDGRKNNGGLDFKLEDGQEPSSIIGGLVTKIEKKDNKGYFVSIKDGNYKIIYGYLQSTELKEGQTIRLDDIIGEVGLNKDGNRYLRIELYIDDELADPEKYIEF